MTPLLGRTRMLSGRRANIVTLDVPSGRSHEGGGGAATGPPLRKRLHPAGHLVNLCLPFGRFRTAPHFSAATARLAKVAERQLSLGWSRGRINRFDNRCASRQRGGWLLGRRVVLFQGFGRDIGEAARVRVIPERRTKSCLIFEPLDIWRLILGSQTIPEHFSAWPGSDPKMNFPPAHRDQFRLHHRTHFPRPPCRPRRPLVTRRPSAACPPGRRCAFLRTVGMASTLRGTCTRRQNGVVPADGGVLERAAHRVVRLQLVQLRE